MIGQPPLDMVDPFIMLDYFNSIKPSDPLAGFPSHGHRGFETVTHILSGELRCNDSLGNDSKVCPGGIQWIKAGSGIVHSEMPERVQGKFWGIQLWINLPATQKMDDPECHVYPAAEIPSEQRGEVQLKVISGITAQGTVGAVKGRATDPLYLDITLPKHQTFEEPIPTSHQGFVFVLEGEVNIEGHYNIGTKTVERNQLAVLIREGEGIKISGQHDRNRILLVLGRELAEPVARHGPFVMNSAKQIKEALSDYAQGKLVKTKMCRV